MVVNKWGKTDFQRMNMHLHNNNIVLEYVGNGYGSLQEAGQHHRVKSIFMVAMTRSRENLFITYSGCMSSYVMPFAGKCSNLQISNILAPSRVESVDNECYF